MFGLIEDYKLSSVKLAMPDQEDSTTKDEDDGTE